MKRKKWTEAEEETLISAYSELLSTSGVISQLRTREKKFQPIADRVNSIHHIRDPIVFPFCWSWRDVSIKIQNMRHQYLGVKLKLSSSSPTPEAPNWDYALQLWPNFLRYKAVFGDIDPNSSPSSSSPVSIEASNDDGKVQNLGKMVAELGEVLVGREESRRERESFFRERRRQRQREMEVFMVMAASEEDEWVDRRERWRRREERRDEEEMQWRERVLGMQMEHEKQVMQMHAEACQAQIQMLGILVRLACQFLSPAASSDAGGTDGGINGLQHHVMNNLHQQQQHSSGSLVGDNGKNDVHSGEDYL